MKIKGKFNDNRIKILINKNNEKSRHLHHRFYWNPLEVNHILIIK